MGAEARFGRSTSSHPSSPSSEGDGGGPLILTQSATLVTHVISAVWRKLRSYDVKVNVKDRARAESRDDDDSSSSSFPPLSLSRFIGTSNCREHWGDLNGLMNDRAALELIVLPESVDDEEPPATVEEETESDNWYRKVGSGAVPPVPSDAPVSRVHYKLREVIESDRILGR